LTALIKGLDPEDSRAITDPVLQIMMDAVHRYDGYVVQALGDGRSWDSGSILLNDRLGQKTTYCGAA
jgi:hypothetical protein